MKKEDRINMETAFVKRALENLTLFQNNPKLLQKSECNFWFKEMKIESFCKNDIIFDYGLLTFHYFYILI
jgi:hypothetical protein